MMEWLRQESPFCIKTDSAVRLSKGLFYLTFILYLIFTTAVDTSLRFENSSYLVIMRYGMWICFFVALLNVIFLCRYSFGQLLFILAFVLFYLLVWHQSGGSEYTFLQGMMIVLSCYHIAWGKLLNFTFILYIPLILVPALLQGIGILPLLEIFRGDQQRYSLGFSHPNALGSYCLCFIILWLLIRYEKLRWWDYIAWLAMAVFVWVVPNSRTSTFLILALIVLTMISKHWGFKLLKGKVVNVLCSSAFIIMAALSFFASCIYDSNNSIIVQIDHTLFTNRISWAHSFLQEYPITLFGQKLHLVGTVRAAMTGTQSAVLDNFYVHQLLSTGIISFFLIIALLTYLAYSATRKRDFAALIGLIVVAVYLVYENNGTELNYNFMLFYVVYQFTEGKGLANDQSVSNRTGL